VFFLSAYKIIVSTTREVFVNLTAKQK